MRLAEFVELFKQIDVEGEWQEAQYFKDASFTVRDDKYDYKTSGHDRSHARFKRGVYRHTAEIGGEETVLYIGKSEGLTSSIAGRQTRHLGAYKNVEFEGEASGKKYRQLMHDYELTALNISIDYVDMTHMPMAMIPMFERATIDLFLPLLNQ